MKFKRTGTRDLIWLKVVSLERSKSPNRNRLAGRAKLADGLLIHKNNPIHICSMIFASSTKLF